MGARVRKESATMHQWWLQGDGYSDALALMYHIFRPQSASSMDGFQVDVIDCSVKV